jgi:histidine triad (HIT) family protein
MDCLFCKIINGDIPSKTIYEDKLVKVFLDINPTTNGDMLIVPKKHYENILDIDAKLIPHIHEVIIKLYKLLKEKLSIDGLTIVQNNGHGQDIKHYHVHVTPRYTNDDIKHTANKEILVDIDNVYEQIKD